MALKLIRTEKTSQEDLQRSEADQADFEWLAAHAEEIEQKYKGKYIAVANRELFIADSFEEARRAAQAKYPQREPYIEFVPLKRRVMVL